MVLERLLDDPALNTFAASVNQPHFAKAGFMRGADVLDDDRRNVARRERVTLDVVLGHCRRYSKESLRQAAEDAGFVVKDIFEFNRIGTPAWFLNGKILRRDTFGLFQIWMLDMLTPLFRRIDWLLPFPGLSLIAVLERRDAYQEEAVSAFGNCVPAR